MDDGTRISGHAEILEQEKKFYNSLYTEKIKPNCTETKEAIKYFVHNNYTIEKLDDEQKDDMEQELTMEDFSQALKDMPNDAERHIPGPRGGQAGHKDLFNYFFAYLFYV